jgi:2-alkyl-3-oxoalkanoate reductase
MPKPAAQCVFLTGATGVLGRAVVRIAHERGYRVRALARSSVSARAIRSLGAEPVCGSLFDPVSVAAAVKGSSAILHLASRIVPITQWRHRSAWVENDRIRCEGTHTLVEAALAHDVGTFVYPSVTLVYPDRGSEWIDAASVRAAPADLTTSTLAAESEVTRFADRGHRGVTLRMGPFYGPESPQSRYMLDLARRRFSPFIARDSMYHPFVWIEDAAEAVVAALEIGQSGMFDVVDDEPLTVAEIVAVLARVTGRRRLWRIPAWLLRHSMGPELALLSARSRRVSNAAYKAAAGWRPSVRSARVGWERIAAACRNPT